MPDAGSEVEEKSHYQAAMEAKLAGRQEAAEAYRLGTTGEATLLEQAEEINARLQRENDALKAALANRDAG